MHGNLPFATTLATAIVAVVVSTSGCSREPVSSGGAPPPPEVAVLELAVTSVALTTELPGRTAPYLVAEVRPQVSGLLLRRTFEEGADVRAGALLYEIDPAPYRAAFNQAEAALGVARAGLPALQSRVDRLEQLVAIDAVGEQDLDDARAALQRAEANVVAAQAAVEAAGVNLSYTPLRAPIGGRIGKSAITPGALVTAFQPVALATIQQLDPIYVDVTQSSAELLALRRRLAQGDLARQYAQKDSVQLVLEDGQPYLHKGTLRFRDVTVDPTTGSVSLRLVFRNPDHVLLPGMFVRAIVEDAVDGHALLVPQQAVTRDPRGQATVYVVNGRGEVEVRPIAIDRSVGHQWLVTSGVAAGDRVVMEGQQRVRAGTAVRAVPYAPPAQTSAAVASPAAGSSRAGGR